MKYTLIANIDNVWHYIAAQQDEVCDILHTALKPELIFDTIESTDSVQYYFLNMYGYDIDILAI